MHIMVNVKERGMGHRLSYPPAHREKGLSASPFGIDIA